ncbi:MAG: flippase-like domain-containing protein [Candidatus Latescibacteria bacterium]|nr:flippase-like domain-containing protein [Candidatus Latescibacterota bacterium]
MKRILFFMLKLIVSVGLVAWAFSGEHFQLDRLTLHFREADFGLLAGAVALFAVSNLLGAVQWNLLLRVQEIELSWREVVSFYFVGVFFNNFLVGNIGGDAIRVYDVRRLTKDGSPAFAATFLDRFIGLFTLTWFSLAAYFLAPTFPGGRSVLALILCVTGALSITIASTFSHRLSRLGERVVLKLVPVSVGKRITKIRLGILRCRAHLKVLALAALVSVGVQLMRVGVHYMVGRSLGLEVSFGYFLVFIPLIAIVASVPVSFGGIGVRENSGVLLFGRLGVEGTVAFSMEFIAYLVGLAASLVGGVVFVCRRQGKHSKIA